MFVIVAGQRLIAQRNTSSFFMLEIYHFREVTKMIHTI
uniref:Uncharacterized protein n=1 Tax=Siphoviridae sp. ctPAi1 TaxID=2826320 RepID=A0A8S5M8T7_9CAUD|nr:MAG TPA: hypothetical protein [Siphoviridae sp. ctPAi1]